MSATEVVEKGERFAVEDLDATAGRLLVPRVAVECVDTRVGSAALEASHIISASACTLRSAKAYNSSGGTLYLQVFNAASLPANGTAPARTPIPVLAGDVNGDAWEGGTRLSTGCVLALSSTIATLTVAGAVGWFDAEVR